MLQQIQDETQTMPTFAPVALRDDAAAEIAEWIDSHRHSYTDSELDEMWAMEMEERDARRQTA